MSIEVTDIQGILLRGYGKLPCAAFMLLAIDDPARARQWLGELEVRSGADLDGDPRACVNVAFTFDGITRLGLPHDAADGFALEFREGMAASDHRRRILGDIGEASPEHWLWGGPSNPPLDILLMCYAKTDADLDELLDAHEDSLTGGGLSLVAYLDSTVVPGFREHFGFRDGLSQPAIAGFDQGAPDHNTVAAGEFILGYENAYGQLTDRPLVGDGDDPGGHLAPLDDGQRDFGRNGSYLVFRQLGQDVAAFWRTVDEHAASLGFEDRGVARVTLAAKMVGRWPDGEPLVRTGNHGSNGAGGNDFLYVQGGDAEGHHCPIGAHVRRTNPRDALDPHPGSARSIEVGKRHRIIRRGRSYGPPLAASMQPSDLLAAGDDGIERGLHFMCFNTHIGRQFEFIQHTWVNNTKFDGLYEDDDPLIGSRYTGGGQVAGSFTIQDPGVRTRVSGMPRFVTVRGGAYFFLPGLRALRYLAAGPP